MAKKDEQKEKPLEKMTAKELREHALTLEGIVGVHAMNKNELIAAIKEAKGIEDEKTSGKAVDVRALKAKIQGLREKREKAKEAGQNKAADRLRHTISNLKKKTRRTA